MSEDSPGYLKDMIEFQPAGPGPEYRLSRTLEELKIIADEGPWQGKTVKMRQLVGRVIELWGEVQGVDFGKEV
jgi:hypothetical protein